MKGLQYVSTFNTRTFLIFDSSVTGWNFNIVSFASTELWQGSKLIYLLASLAHIIIPFWPNKGAQFLNADLTYNIGLEFHANIILIQIVICCSMTQ